MSAAPQVFVSHASEDKERFVVPFATALRDNGVNAWLDKWEILPGDSLVDKLFEEGLKSAAAVVIVLSQHSANKPWVKEELNKAIVDRVAKQIKIIPIVIDDCEVPEALKSTVWERVTDLQHFEPSLERVLNAIFEKREKPPLGKPPSYFIRESISGLTGADTTILQAVYDLAIEANSYVISADILFDKISATGITKDTYCDSLLVLDERSYIEAKKAMNSSFGNIVYVRPSHFGFMRYAEAFLPQFEESVSKIKLQILNHGLKHNRQIAEVLAIPVFIVDQILEDFSYKNWVTLSSRTLGGHCYVMSVSPTMKRQFE